MAIYEYRCESQDCQHVFEVWAKISDPAPTECPKCHHAGVGKLISNTAFALKGSGWYTSDYKRSATTKPADTAAPASGTACATGGCGAGKCESN